MFEVESGSWLCFSRKVATKTAVEYSESGNAVSNYYVQRARWAHTALELRESANTGGEVVLWIAFEYFEEGLKNLYPLENVANLPEDICFVRVDDNFQYGQNFAKTDRLLVYHPRMRQKMIQGRFRPNLFAVACAGLDNIFPDVEVSGFGFKLKKSMFKTLTGAGTTVIGHPLHRFKTPKELQPKKSDEPKPKKPALPKFSLHYVTLAAFNSPIPDNAIINQVSIIPLSQQEKSQLAQESEVDAQQIQDILEDVVETEDIHINQVAVFKLSEKLKF